MNKFRKNLKREKENRLQQIGKKFENNILSETKIEDNEISIHLNE